MRGLSLILSFVAVIGLAFWAYHENYQTQQSIREVRQLQDRIGAAHARINMLNAEWAYLNRPDRLRDLAELNFDRLGLLPLMPDRFGRVDQIAYEPSSRLPVLTPIEVSSANAAAQAGEATR